MAAFLLTSCEPIVEPEMFGLTPTSKLIPEVRIAGCPTQAYSVLLTLAGQPARPLWELAPLEKNRVPTLPERFLIGSVPEGWKDIVSLRRALATGVEYQIYVSSREAYVVSLAFSLEDLRPGYILDFGGNLVPTRRFPLRTTCAGA
jgi:hypothetical protein